MKMSKKWNVFVQCGKMQSMKRVEREFELALIWCVTSDERGFAPMNCGAGGGGTNNYNKKTEKDLKM